MIRTARRVERLTQELATARNELQRDVTAAHRSGESVAEIARTLGVTRTRVYQLLEKRH